MTEPKIVKLWIDTAATPAEVVESAGLVEVASGWNATLSEEGQTATFRVARMDANQPRIVAVRSFSLAFMAVIVAALISSRIIGLVFLVDGLSLAAA